MAKALATVGNEKLPSTVRLLADNPVITEALDMLAEPVRKYQGGDGEAALAIRTPFAPSSKAVDYAKSTLARTELYLTKVPDDVLWHWLGQLNDALNWQNGEDVLARGSRRRQGYQMALEDLPLIAFSDDALKRAIKAFGWMKSPSEIFQWLQKDAAEAIARLEALRRVAAYKPRPVSNALPPPEVTQEEREAVLARAREIRDQLVASDKEKRRDAIRSLPDASLRPADIRTSLEEELRKPSLTDKQRALLRFRLESMDK